MPDETQQGGEVSSYTPDEDIKVHPENAIRLICKPFQSHESGLPEWAKNAADEYARTNAPEHERVIVLVMQNGRRGGPSNVIACLDFSGMTSDVIEHEFRHWADPEASRRAGEETNVQGGHGNGGKCYMTQMFEDCAYIHAVKGNRGCVYGTVGGSIRLGYFPDRDRGRDFDVADVRTELDTALVEIGLAVDDLPNEAVAALDRRQGFTLVVGRGAKGYELRVPAAQLVGDLVDHPQMRMTLELCSVHALAQGRPLNGGKPLRLPEIPPLPGGETPRVVPIPDRLPDPVSGLEISTTGEGATPEGALTLKTSETRMWRGAKKSRHNIVYKAESGYIGYRPVQEFDVFSSYRDRIFGDCVLRSLEDFKLNERAALASSPLVRALDEWIGEQIEAYAKEFEARDRQKHDQEEKDALAQINAALDRWKNDLLDKVLSDVDGAGEQGGGGGPPPPPPLPSGNAARIEISLTFYRAGVGVALRPALRAFNAAGEPIRPPAVMWHSDDPSVAAVDEDLRIINTFEPGVARLHCQTFDGQTASNSVALEVVEILSIALQPDELEVPAGSRRRVAATCRLASEEEADDVALMWTESEPSIARVSAAGMVFGFTPGTTEITAADERCTAGNSVTTIVVPGEDGGGSGRGYPRVLISEIDADPDTGEDVVLSPDDPPVHQQVHDVERNIWWINSASPLARLYLDASHGFGPETREWRIYHLERYVDVIVQISMSQGPESEDELDVGEWIARWGERAADVQSAAVVGLATFIENGDLPS
ncbi:MAG: hypothetical protein WAQ33_12025 [Gaiellaceae bacterium]